MPGAAFAQTASLSGTLRDETGGALPGVSVELESGGAARRIAVTDAHGGYRFDAVPAGPAQCTFTLINFATARRDVDDAGVAAPSVSTPCCISPSAPTSP